MGAARISETLVLDIESCDCLAGCPGCGAIAQGHGRMVVDMPRAHLPDHDLHRAEPLGVCSPDATGCPGDPLGDWSAALRGSNHLWLGPTTQHHVEYRVVPYRVVSASHI